MSQHNNSGGSVDYYTIDVSKPTSALIAPYKAECNDIIRALRLEFAEANIIKAIWRIAAGVVKGTKKDGNDAKYDAEKILFFAIDVALKHGVDIPKILGQRGYGGQGFQVGTPKISLPENPPMFRAPLPNDWALPFQNNQERMYL